MIRKNQVRAVGEVQPAGDVHPAFVKRLDLADQRGGINHHTGSDNRMRGRPQNAAGDKLQNETMAVENDCVSRVVAAEAARDVIERPRQVINDLALPFVTPLRAHHDDRLHSVGSLSARRPAPFRFGKTILGPQEGRGGTGKYSMLRRAT